MSDEHAARDMWYMIYIGYDPVSMRFHTLQNFDPVVAHPYSVVMFAADVTFDISAPVKGVFLMG